MYRQVPHVEPRLVRDDTLRIEVWPQGVCCSWTGDHSLLWWFWIAPVLVTGALLFASVPLVAPLATAVHPANPVLVQAVAAFVGFLLFPAMTLLTLHGARALLQRRRSTLWVTMQGISLERNGRVVVPPWSQCAFKRRYDKAVEFRGNSRSDLPLRLYREEGAEVGIWRGKRTTTFRFAQGLKAWHQTDILDLIPVWSSPNEMPQLTPELQALVGCPPTRARR